MGSPDNEAGRSDDEGPRTTVRIEEPFFLGRTEVTVEQFSRFVESAGYEPDAKSTGCYVWREGKLDLDYDADWTHLTGFDTGPGFPAVCVRWRDAFRYVDWLSEQTGARYRLPTEAEWEYAARADTDTPRYWGGAPALACDNANVADHRFEIRYAQLARDVHDCDDGYSQAAPVARYPPNPFGLHDVLGNVWEWTVLGVPAARDRRCPRLCRILDTGRAGPQGGWLVHSSWRGALGASQRRSIGKSDHFRRLSGPARAVRQHRFPRFLRFLPFGSIDRSETWVKGW